MDPILKGKALRARRLIEEVAGAGGPTQEQKAEAARQIHFLKAVGKRGTDLREAMEQNNNPLVQRAAVLADTLGSDDFGEAALDAAWLTSTPELNLLDAILDQGGTPLVPGTRAGFFGSGWTSNFTAEGAPKVLRQSGAQLDELKPHKTAVITAASMEAYTVEGFAAWLDAEHRLGLARGTNAAVLDLLLDSNTQTAATLEDAMAVAGPAIGFVVAMPAGEVAAMALQAAKNGNTTFGVRGGLLAPGLRIVAIDDAQDTTVIPASRLMVRDFGLRVATAKHAGIEMSDTPTGEGEMVSMFQTNAAAILSERSFIIGGDFSGVVVVPGGSGN